MQKKRTVEVCAASQCDWSPCASDMFCLQQLRSAQWPVLAETMDSWLAQKHCSCCLDQITRSHSHESRIKVVLQSFWHNLMKSVGVKWTEAGWICESVQDLRAMRLFVHQYWLCEGWRLLWRDVVSCTLHEHHHNSSVMTVSACYSFHLIHWVLHDTNLIFFTRCLVFCLPFISAFEGDCKFRRMLLMCFVGAIIAACHSK